MVEPALPFFLARPSSAPPWPGVVVVHEGNGMSPQLLRVCERLAGEGFVAIAPDLFWRFGGSDPDKAAELKKRGFPSMLLHSSVRGSDTPNEDRASAIVKALQGVTEQVVIVGISNPRELLAVGCGGPTDQAGHLCQCCYSTPREDIHRNLSTGTSRRSRKLS